MRQRKVAHEEERLLAASQYSVKNPKEMAGKWVAYARKEMQIAETCSKAPSGISPAVPSEVTSDASSDASPVVPSASPEIYLEMGCGRGQFLVKQALAHPENFYVGAEGRASIVVRALELIQAGGCSEEAAGGNDFGTDARRELLREKLEHAAHEPLKNARCITEYIERVEESFAPGELSGVYCNFSDPWPKGRHEKRRLTSAGFLEGYRKALKPGGFIAIKTDNDALFAFTLSVLYQLQNSTAELPDRETVSGADSSHSEDAHTPKNAHTPEKAHTPENARTPEKVHAPENAHTPKNAHTPESARTPEKVHAPESARTPEEWRTLLSTTGPFAVTELSFDLHKSDYEAKEITTQYEDRFIELGTPVKYCKIVAR